MVFWGVDIWDDSDEFDSVQDVVRCDLCDDLKLKLYCNICMKSLCKLCMGEYVFLKIVIKYDIVRFQYRN